MENQLSYDVCRKKNDFISFANVENLLNNSINNERRGKIEGDISFR